jgi:hypothetical protein
MRPPLTSSRADELLTMRSEPMPSPAQTRLLWAACLALASAVLAIARALTPDPAGFGTHTQLGLPPCLFRVLTGLPCPSCGLTTAFAHMARLEITDALRAHALGPLLFALTLLLIPLSTWGMLRAWPVAHAIKRLRVARLAAIIAAAVLGCWLVRVLTLLLA